jgi:uncharacterized membrane protein YhiD involved in acid resistance
MWGRKGNEMIKVYRNEAGVLKRGKQGSTRGDRRSEVPVNAAAGPALKRATGWFSRLANRSMLRAVSIPVGLIFLLLIPSRLFGQNDSSVFSQVLEGHSEVTLVGGWVRQATMMTFRLSLAALLAAVLAFRPHKALPIIHRNPYVKQTQILLAVVAAALMMIVSDNAARAFGIFAATSLVRFRTNISDPKEITVLLVNLGIGLAAGVGRWELAIILCLFVLLLLLLLEYQEARQVYRAMQLKVRTHNADRTEEVLRELFERHKINAELSELDRQDERSPLGKVVYRADVSANVDTDGLSEEIFSADSENIDSIEWQQKKKASSYVYN